ncbi:MAG: hypothetical protein P8079_10270, partial [Gammaproteobacteria bacterium]
MLTLGPVLIPLTTAVLCTLLAKQASARRLVSLAGSLLLLGNAIFLLHHVIRHGRSSIALGGWPLPYAIELAADGLSAVMILVTALLGMATVLYHDRWQDPLVRQAGTPALMHGLLASAIATFL